MKISTLCRFLFVLSTVLGSGAGAFAQDSQPISPTESANNPDNFWDWCGTVGSDDTDTPPDTTNTSRLNPSHTGHASAAKGNQPPAIIWIPVAVHILWYNQPGNDGAAKITVTQVQDQIDALNRDFMATNKNFAKIKQGFPAFFANVAGSARIQFCLAQRDINGRYGSNNPNAAVDPGEPVIAGVERIDLINTGNNLSDFDYTINGSPNPRDPTILPSLPNWPPSDYLNIWVANLGGSNFTHPNVAGASTMPNSPSVFGTYQDGIVMHTT